MGVKTALVKIQVRKDLSISQLRHYVKEMGIREYQNEVDMLIKKQPFTVEGFMEDKWFSFDHSRYGFHGIIFEKCIDTLEQATEL